MTRRYVIIGAGAIGAGVGGLLAHQGVPVLLVARGAHLHVMRDRGLTVRTPDETCTVAAPVAGGPDEVQLTTDDVLVLTTKTHQAEAALAEWADAPVTGPDQKVVGTAGSTLPLLTALNGVASETMALRWFARVYGVCVWMPAVLLEPGEVIIRGGPARAAMHVGRAPVELSTEADAELLAEIKTDWESARVLTPTPPDVMRWKYRKLLGNLGNAFQALLGDATHRNDLVERCRNEAKDLIAQAGIPLNTEAEEGEARKAFTVQPVPGEPARLGGSTWQSLARGTGSAESDYLNGEVVALAHRLGRTAPVNAVVAQLMREAVRSGAKPGDLTDAELRRRLASTGAETA